MADVFAYVSRERLTAGIEQAAPHLRPIWEAIRDCGIGFGLVNQHVGRFDPPKGRPTLVLLGDDMHEALGPAAFHSRSVRRFVATCDAAVIVACDAQVRFYAAAAVVPALRRRNAILIETRSEREADWIDFVRSASPHIRMLVGTVAPPTAARH